ncbi:hypothetical protein [Kitasatospora sp. MBT63]|nr:hypothetical protein [Kitasatospora sp. MBT63]
MGDEGVVGAGRDMLFEEGALAGVGDVDLVRTVSGGPRTPQ